MNFLSGIFSKVATGASSIVSGVTNPINTIAGYAQGILRGRVGAPLLQGANTAVVEQARSQLAPKPSVQGPVTPAKAGFFTNIQKGIGTAFDSVIGKIQSSISKVSQTARTEAVKNEQLKATGDVFRRLTDIGLSGVDNLVQRLTGAGNREAPRPIDVTTGRALGSTQDGAVLAQNPGILPDPFSFLASLFSPNPENVGRAGEVGETGSTVGAVIDRPQTSGSNAGTIIGVIAIAGAAFLVFGRRRRRK